MKVRVKFSKNGAIRFIGHLDVMRYFQKMLRRADIDVSYTTGFSPHQIMSFAAPLGVGITSDGEYMDIECDSVSTSKQMMEQMNAASVEGMRILGVKELPENSENAMASVAAAAYFITFREGKTPNFDYLNRVDEFMKSEEILITKETKKNTLEVNIRPGIYTMEARDNGIYLFVDASSAGNIKPLHVMEAYAKANGCELMENPIHIHRLDTFTDIGTEDNHNFISMGEVGSEILTPRVDEERIKITEENIRRKKEAIEEANQLRERLLAEKKAEIEEWNRLNEQKHQQ